jgi:hypothetical protein
MVRTHTRCGRQPVEMFQLDPHNKEISENDRQFTVNERQFQAVIKTVHGR